MIEQLIIGSLVISLTVTVEAVFIGLAIAVLRRHVPWMMRPPFGMKTIISLICVTLWLMAAHSIGVWIWAATFLQLGAFDALEPAIYFSIISFTTLGFGDIVLTEKWRVLSGLTAANGLLIFALSAAFLVEFLTRVRQAQSILLQRSNDISPGEQEGSSVPGGS